MLPKLYDDIAIMLSHIYIRPEEAVRRWSNVECDDYQIVLACIIGFLSHAVPPISRTHILVRDKPEFQVVLDIVMNSNLNPLLEYDAAERSIKYRETVSLSAKEEIARFIYARSSGIADPF